MAPKDVNTRPPLFERLKTGLEEGIEFAKGNLNLKTTEVPEPPPGLTAEDVVEIRQRVAVSQALFARLLNVSPKTVQSWEQGLRQPSQSALRLLQIVGHSPDVVCQIVGASKRTRAKRTSRSTRKQ